MSMKAKYPADLHCHTSASDGLFSPRELIRLAAARGLKVVGITDHDTIDGWQEAEKAAGKAGITVIKGIEINTDWQGKEVHILGYYLKGGTSFLENNLSELQQKRLVRIKEILEKLKNMGINISLAEVLGKAKGKSVGRPHVAQAMVNGGYARSFPEAFEKYLKIGMPAYVPRYKLDPEEAIAIIREAQGVAVLAHPGTQHLSKEIYTWAEAGLQGIEVCHPEHSNKDTVEYRLIADKMGLISTGGSDYHGPGLHAGAYPGDYGVELVVVEKLKQTAGSL